MLLCCKDKKWSECKPLLSIIWWHLHLGLPLPKPMHLHEIMAKITQFLSYNKNESFFQIFCLLRSNVNLNSIYHQSKKTVFNYKFYKALELLASWSRSFHALLWFTLQWNEKVNFRGFSISASLIWKVLISFKNIF